MTTTTTFQIVVSVCVCARMECCPVTFYRNPEETVHRNQPTSDRMIWFPHRSLGSMDRSVSCLQRDKVYGFCVGSWHFCECAVRLPFWAKQKKDTHRHTHTIQFKLNWLTKEINMQTFENWDIERNRQKHRKKERGRNRGSNVPFIPNSKHLLCKTGAPRLTPMVWYRYLLSQLAEHG